MKRLSTEKQNELVERVFLRLTTLYGNKFADMWRGIDQGEVKAAWLHELLVFTPHQIGYALDLLTSYSPEKRSGQEIHAFPPTLPELLGLCVQAQKVVPRGDVLALEKKPNTYNPNDPELVAARDRCMANMRKMNFQKQGNRDWAYRVIAKHDITHDVEPEALRLALEAIRTDPNRVEKRKAA